MRVVNVPGIFLIQDEATATAAHGMQIQSCKRNYQKKNIANTGPVWIHGLELVLANWSSTSHKVSKHEG
jgi:hypothetical protein